MKTSRPNPVCFASSLAIFSLLATASVPVSAQRASAATSNATGPPPVRTTLSFSGTDQTEYQDYDRDDDGLIEVANLAQLDAMRYDLDGDGMVEDEDEARYDTAFPQGVPGMGCPLECEGYELTADCSSIPTETAEPTPVTPAGRAHDRDLPLDACRRGAGGDSPRA